MDTRVALCHLDSRLHDNHGKVIHPGRPITGIVPISFRKFGDRIVVVGGIPEYLQTIQLGSELLAINGTPAQEAYAQTTLQISAATEGLRDYLTPARMTMGNPGELWKLRILHLDGRVNDHLLPLVDDGLYGHANREPRPANGAELSPGIYYLDLDALSSDVWAQLASRLDRAQAIIFDFRGYVTSAAYDVISHITDQELKSPIWQAPLIPRIDDIKYSISQWSVFPQTPRGWLLYHVERLCAEAEVTVVCTQSLRGLQASSLPMPEPRVTSSVRLPTPGSPARGSSSLANNGTAVAPVPVHPPEHIWDSPVAACAAIAVRYTLLVPQALRR